MSCTSRVARGDSNAVGDYLSDRWSWYRLRFRSRSRGVTMASSGASLALAFGALMAGAVAIDYGSKAVGSAFGGESSSGTGTSENSGGTGANPFGSFKNLTPSNKGAKQGDTTFGDLLEVGKEHNWNLSQLKAWWEVISLESGGRLDAQNPHSDAYGIAQFINGAGEYANYGGSSTTVIGQLTSMANYIEERYGTPEAALAHENSYHWY